MDRFVTDFYVMVARRVDWTTQLIDTWPDDVRDAPFEVAAAQESVRLAESVAKVLPERRARIVADRPTWPRHPGSDPDTA